MAKSTQIAGFVEIESKIYYYRRKSMAWMTPFVAGMFCVETGLLFTFIFPVRDKKGYI